MSAKIFLGWEWDVIKNQIEAFVMNIISWFLDYFPSLKPAIPPLPKKGDQQCVIVSGPGGLDRLQLVSLNLREYPYGERVTVGYNVQGFPPPFVRVSKPLNFPPDSVLVKIQYFSVNYADVCIRWGLYESALRYVGWPIVPGFDFSGTIAWAGEDTDFTIGEKIFGFTMFGAYSSSLLVPARQVRRVPKSICLHPERAAAIPAVAATALHSIALVGAWPNPLISTNKACLIHSAAGGVGSMLVQMCRLQGFNPIVAVVGNSTKISVVKNLGADYVIDKSTVNLWKEAKRISSTGYAAIFDANGVETLSNSYEALSRCGKLVTYGFHSNLPRLTAFLSPMAWLKMFLSLFSMPKFDPLDLVLNSRSVSGFNLSFFADEHEIIERYLAQVIDWIDNDKIKVDNVTVFDMKDISMAHNLIQSGNSIGKICIKVPN